MFLFSKSLVKFCTAGLRALWIGEILFTVNYIVKTKNC